jgi:hypothetical protein
VVVVELGESLQRDWYTLYLSSVRQSIGGSATGREITWRLLLG